MARCPKHRHVTLRCPACLGEITSEAKAAAARENGKKGGRPAGSKNKPKVGRSVT